VVKGHLGPCLHVRNEQNGACMVAKESYHDGLLSFADKEDNIGTISECLDAS